MQKKNNYVKKLERCHLWYVTVYFTDQDIMQGGSHKLNSESLAVRK